MTQIARLREFVQSFTRLVDDSHHDESRIFSAGKTLLSDLIRHDDWLPDAFARASPDRYQQYLLYCDPLERFSVVSFVWGPGQDTPVHDHTVWGMVGVLRGAEMCHEYNRADDQLTLADQHRLERGEIDLVSPAVGDIHTVANALQDQVSLSIHVYGANIGALERHVYDADNARAKAFISGYDNTVIPNLWNRSIEQ
jgi:predicted metal-dependent enzyme (double-stranded beta helix superfamily)